MTRMIKKACLALLVLSTVALPACSSGLPALSQPVSPTESNTGWKTFKADSGYAISYPLDRYSIRTAPTPSEVLFPGVKVIEPNDAFSYREPRAVTYKLSIAVSENTGSLSLDDPQALLPRSLTMPYDPQLLADHPIREITLDGVRALRVDDLPVGPAGLTSQIVAIHHNRIFELLVEPHQLTGNQAEPFQTGEAVPANRELMEDIVATFQFSD